MNLLELSATELAQRIQDGLLDSEELVRACLQRIDSLEQQVGAWAWLDPELALNQAREADARRRAGSPLGPLHGIPVGVKDIFDTQDMPTEDGTVLHAGRTPAYDAAAVALLRVAGAVILGKTVTTELAVYAPGKTRNPHNLEHTPGGSSSGSAAAVASAMVPLALGTQTNGSVIRPASFCGVYGYKPSYGLISRHRVLRQSPALDHVGVFARCMADLALLAEPLMAFDERDSAMRARARPPLIARVDEPPPVPPKLAFVKTPAWEKATADLRQGFDELVEFLGDRVEPLDLDEQLTPTYAWHQTIMEADLAISFRREFQRGTEVMSPTLRQMIERGLACPAVDYNLAMQQLPGLHETMEELLLEYDAILTPAAPGEAPQGLQSTGDPCFSTPWTLLGMPAVSLPLLQGSNALPIGVQLVAARGDDARLLRTANWLVHELDR